MKYIEYGKENKETVILLHGGGLSWWNYKEAANTLKKNYHVILPILDGHADSDHDFISIEDNAQRIINFIDDSCKGHVTLIGGLSLGGQITIEILSQRTHICDYAIIESALIKPMKITHLLVKPMMDMSYGLIKQPWFSRLQFKSLKIRNDLYEDYYRDTCAIKKDNMISFLKANSNYSIKDELKNTTTDVHIYVGKKEQSNMIQSAITLNKIIPNSKLSIIDHKYHGEFSINDPDVYINEINKIINKGKM